MAYLTSGQPDRFDSEDKEVEVLTSHIRLALPRDWLTPRDVGDGAFGILEAHVSPQVG